METGPYRLAAEPPSRGLGCPRCRAAETRLLSRRIAELEIEECPTCRGQWLDREVFGEVVMDPDRQRQIIEQARLARITAVDNGGVDCPSCGVEMIRKNFARSSGVHIDVCAAHGVWLDDGELRQIAEHVRRQADDLTAEPRARAPMRPARNRYDADLPDADLTIPPPPEPPKPPARELDDDHDGDHSDLISSAIVFIGDIALRLFLGKL